METITQGTSTNGTTYRIICWSACNQNFFEIERLKVYYHDDGTPCNCWFPAYEPKQKTFTNINEAQKALSYLLIPF